MLGQGQATLDDFFGMVAPVGGIEMLVARQDLLLDVKDELVVHNYGKNIKNIN